MELKLVLDSLHRPVSNLKDVTMNNLTLTLLDPAFTYSCDYG